MSKETPQPINELLNTVEVRPVTDPFEQAEILRGLQDNQAEWLEGTGVAEQARTELRFEHNRFNYSLGPDLEAAKTMDFDRIGTGDIDGSMYLEQGYSKLPGLQKPVRNIKVVFEVPFVNDPRSNSVGRYPTRNIRVPVVAGYQDKRGLKAVGGFNMAQVSEMNKMLYGLGKLRDQKVLPDLAEDMAHIKTRKQTKRRLGKIAHRAA